MIPRLLATCVLIWLTACSIPAPVVEDASADTTVSDGSSTAELAVSNFLSDLGLALGDRSLRQNSVQRYWADRLSRYFAPNERSAQRAAIGDMLALFASNRGALAANEAATVEILFAAPTIVAREGGRVLVQVPEAKVRMEIIRTVDQNPTTIYQQEIAFADLVGRADGTLPVTQIGARWYLTSS